MKKFVSMFLAAVMCLTIPVFAAEKETHNNQREADLVKTMNNEYIFSAPVTAYPSKDSYSNDTSITVFSPEFEDAYIEVEEYNISDFRVEKFNGKISVSSSNPHTQQFINEVVTNDDELLQSIAEGQGAISSLVAATVYVDEEYDFVDGEYIIVSSRLLSEEEVNSLNSSSQGQPITESKGKLTITFVCNTVSETSTSSKYKLTGKAKWSGAAIAGDKGPSSGLDFFGFAWAGGFTSSNRTAYLTEDEDLGLEITLAEAPPNAGVVWQYYEAVRDQTYEDPYYVYPVGNISCEISKNKLTGDGNYAQAVLKYIHTYQSATGSISFSASISGVGAGFSLSDCAKQWSIVCIADDLLY